MDSARDVYSDEFTLSIGHYGVTIMLGLSPAVPGPTAAQMHGTPVAVVRVSLEQAKVLALALHRALRQHELERLGDPIPLPRALVEALGLADEKW